MVEEATEQEEEEQEGVENMEYTSEEEFEEAHENVCGYEGPWIQVSGEYEPTRVQCPECGATMTLEQDWFNSDANPQYDDSGRKTGSGEYEHIEFRGVIQE